MAVKEFRDVQYGHKINLSSEVNGFITALSIEQGNPGDKTLFLPVGASLTAMGVKSKTYHALRDFRAGIEGSISELKRAFGASKARWKGHDGFKAFVWGATRPGLDHRFGSNNEQKHP